MPKLVEVVVTVIAVIVGTPPAIVHCVYCAVLVCVEIASAIVPATVVMSVVETDVPGTAAVVPLVEVVLVVEPEFEELDVLAVL